MSQLILDPVLSGYNLAKVNDNFKRIEEAFNTLLLHKDGSKALTSDLDVNSQKLLNVGGIEIGGVDLLESIVSLQESYNAYISEMETYRKAVEGILEEAISYGAVDKKSIGNSQAIFTTSQAYAKNSNLTLPLKYIVGKNTLSLSLGHTYLLYKGVDYEEVGVVGEESQTIKILRASGIGIGVTIEQVVDGDNDLYSIFSTASSLQTLLTTSYPPNKIEAFINSVSDVKELRIEDKISELWDIYNNLSALQVSFANIVADVNTKYSTITDMYEDIGTKYSVLETLYPQLVELIADTNFDLNGLNAAIGDLLSNLSRLEGLTNTIESNASAAASSAVAAESSATSAASSATVAQSYAQGVENNASAAASSEENAQVWAEGTDTEVEGLLGEHSSKGWANIASGYASSAASSLNSVRTEITEIANTASSNATLAGTYASNAATSALQAQSIMADYQNIKDEAAVAIEQQTAVADSIAENVRHIAVYVEGTDEEIEKANLGITHSAKVWNDLVRETAAEIAGFDVNAYYKKSEMATVATSGSYNDLINKPTINSSVVQGSSNLVTSNAVSEAISTAIGGLDPIPSGLICMWSGAIANIPSGWHLCDGTNNTPDLRDRFIVGAGNSYNVGATGGANSRSVTIADTISISISGDTENKTAFNTENKAAFNTNDSTAFDTGAASGNTGSVTLTTDQIPSHSHTVSIPKRQSSSTNLSVYTKTSDKGIPTQTTSSTGGGGSHAHTLNSHKHSVGAHNHQIPAHNHQVPAHNHSFSGTGTYSLSKSASVDTRSLYYALCFIMKV